MIFSVFTCSQRFNKIHHPRFLQNIHPDPFVRKLLPVSDRCSGALRRHVYFKETETYRRKRFKNSATSTICVEIINTPYFNRANPPITAQDASYASFTLVPRNSSSKTTTTLCKSRTCSTIYFYPGDLIIIMTIS